MTMARHYGIKKIAVPSAGNAGGAAAAYAAAAGIEAHIFMPKDVPLANQVECTVYGAHMTLVDGLISDCARIVAERKQQEGWFDLSTLKEPFRIEGKKTMGYELVEQSGWSYPDAVFYPTGGGVGLIGMWKAFEEMEELGWVTGKRPKMIAIQAAGCAPVARAFDRHEPVSQMWQNAATFASGLRVPKPYGDYLILEIVRASQGTVIALSDGQIFASLRDWAANEGIFLSPEGAAATAAYSHLLATGFLTPSDRVVLFNTGSGNKYTDVIATPLGSPKASSPYFRFGCITLIHRTFNFPPYSAHDLLGKRELFQVCPHQVNQILGKLRGNLFLRAVRQMKANMRLQHLAHQAVDPAPHGRKQHQLVSAIILGLQRPLHCIQLSTQLAHPLQQLHFFPLVMRHDKSPMNFALQGCYTYRGYSIYPSGVSFSSHHIPPHPRSGASPLRQSSLRQSSPRLSGIFRKLPLTRLVLTAAAAVCALRCAPAKAQVQFAGLLPALHAEAPNAPLPQTQARDFKQTPIAYTIPHTFFYQDGAGIEASDTSSHDSEREEAPILSMAPHSGSSPWWISGQANIIFQGRPAFHSSYQGANSFRNSAEYKTSMVGTLYTALRPTNSIRFNTDFIFDLESAGGRGLSEALGLAGFTNLDVVRNPNLGSTPYPARYEVHQTIGLSQATTEQQPSFFALATRVPVRRIELRIGKLTLPDFFDINSVGSDSHLQFMNWTIDNNGAWDYAADTRGYSTGGLAEYDDKVWSIRYGIFAMPTVANGIDLDWAFSRAHGQNGEFELRKGWVANQKGVSRLLFFANRAHMGTYREANNAFLEGIDKTPSIVRHEHFGALKYGFGYNTEQPLTANLRLFGRFGWNEGQHESFAYTEVDQTISGGADYAGTRWGRPVDKVAIAIVSNGIKSDHQEYLKLGGLGFLLGDGNLNYGRETIVESYYNWHAWRGLFYALDVQHIQNPGYNRDRGPAWVCSVRAHVDF
jgi:high affinity Mn2+ porin